MQTPSDPLPPWLLPHMHTPFRFIDGLAEDMLGYIFPSGNAVGIPTLSNLDPSRHRPLRVRALRRLGGGLRDTRPNLIGSALVGVLSAHGGPAETTVVGRYVLPGGTLSRDPLGGPEIKCIARSDVHRGRAPRERGPPGLREGSCIRRCGCRSADCPRNAPTATRAATSTRAAGGCGSTCSRICREAEGAARWGRGGGRAGLAGAGGLPLRARREPLQSRHVPARAGRGAERLQRERRLEARRNARQPARQPADREGQSPERTSCAESAG